MKRPQARKMWELLTRRIFLNLSYVTKNSFKIWSYDYYQCLLSLYALQKVSSGPNKDLQLYNVLKHTLPSRLGLNNYFSTQDIDHRVREATQQAMEQLVLKVGRNLAPHLRYVIGPWLCAQFDTYAVVASSGKRSFQAAFSDEKQAEVIMFCRKELFEVCFDDLFVFCY